MVISMSGTGNCYDNAAPESFLGSLKDERVHCTRYRSHEEVLHTTGAAIDNLTSFPFLCIFCDFWVRLSMASSFYP